jgi:hypothetical protein
MRSRFVLLLALSVGCSGTLYQSYAGPANGTPDEVYACVQEQLKTLGYGRTQFDSSERWYVAQKISRETNSSGLYRQTLDVLDTKVKSSAQSRVTLEIAAHTYDQYANARGDDRQERAASDRVQADARTLGAACTK